MSFDAVGIWAFLCVFVRCSAMLLSSPLFGGLVPVPVRVMISGVLALALTPVVASHFPQVPEALDVLVLALMREAGIGLVIGFFMQLMMLSIQMAGAFLDLQVGLGAAQIFNPAMSSPTTILGQWKFLLGLVVLLLLNGHHLMIGAFVHSFEVTQSIGLYSLTSWIEQVPRFAGQSGLLSLQIAAPVAAVSFVIDAALGVINKSVPQMQAFMVGVPAKIGLGMIALSLGLPVFAVAVESGVEHTLAAIARLLGGG